MNADGTGVTPIPNTGVNANGPAWSPDGTRIAFANAPGPWCPRADECGGYDIYTVSLDGIGLARLTTHPLTDEEPAWSPDGSQIAFSSGQDPTSNGAPEIYKMSSNGTNQVPLTSAAFAPGDHDPNWSPDGQKIVFSSSRDAANEDVWIMNSDGTGQVRVTTNDSRGLFPVWSPNGQRVAFTSDRSGDAYSIYSIKPDGTGLLRLTSTAGVRDIDNGLFDLEPDWQPAPIGNRAPSCSGVTVSPQTLGSDRSFVLASLGGASDPDGDPVSIDVTGVTQDEPLTGGSDKTAPDAASRQLTKDPNTAALLDNGPNQVYLRAERQNNRDGRVYRVSFTVSDFFGATCAEVRTVSSPRRGSAGVDSAPPSYDSFGP